MRQRSTAVRMGFIGLFAFTVILFGCDSLLGGGDDNSTGGGGDDNATYTITYDANGSDGGSVPTDDTEYETGDSITVAQPGSMSRSGYTFSGWNTADDGTGISYPAGSSVTMESADVTLYAEWAVITYTVSYDANGAGSGSAPSNQTKTEGSDVTVAYNSGNLALGGFTLAGWNTASDGSGGSYSEGATYSGDADVTLYAQWTYEDYAIGDTGPAGGKIFYDDEADGEDDIAGARYLEAAPASTEWNDKEWGGYGTDVNDDNTSVAPELDGVGAGEANTEAIVTAFGDAEPYDGLTDYAAKLCRDLEHGGYDDWFLPSKEELHLMYQNQEDIGVFASDLYWSSSESSADYAWGQVFASGNRGSYVKYGNETSADGVRAVRAF